MTSTLIIYLSTCISSKKRQMKVFNLIMDTLYKQYNIDFKQYNECFNLIVNKSGDDYKDSFISIINMISNISPFGDAYDEFDVFDDIVDTIIEGQYIHFKNLLNEIDSKCKVTSYKYNNQLINKYTLLKDEFNAIMIDASKINFPKNFIYWKSDDLIITLRDYFINTNTNSLFYTDTDNYIFCESLYNLLNKHFSYNTEWVAELYFNILNSYYIQKSREKLNIYMEELTIKTWAPNRLYNWCFDNEDKNDFEE
jgi:hypothetical protein